MGERSPTKFAGAQDDPERFPTAFHSASDDPERFPTAFHSAIGRSRALSHGISQCIRRSRVLSHGISQCPAPVVALPVSGLDIEIVRTYDSRDQQPRDSASVGALRLANGVPSIGGGCFADARFDFIDGPLPGTTLEILGQTQVFHANGSDGVIDIDTLEPYEPEDVRLTTRDGRIFELDLNQGVTLVDTNGNQLSITPAGITHSSGKGIAFERDAAGRIERITDPLSRVNGYVYDAAGDLASFSDRTGAGVRRPGQRGARDR